MNKYIEKRFDLGDGRWCRFYKEHDSGIAEIAVFSNFGIEGVQRKISEIKIPEYLLFEMVEAAKRG